MIAAFLPVILTAQNTPLSSLYDRYASEPGFETTEILPGSMSFEWEKTAENDQVKEMMQNIESIRILKYKSEKEMLTRKNYGRKCRKLLPMSNILKSSR